MIRSLRPEERTAWLRLRERLWPDAPSDHLRAEQDEILANPHRHAVLVAPIANDLAGFVEVSLRDWAEGCETRPVGYIEAWYVEPEHRRAGVGRRLIAAAEDWARARGCSELASDAELDNQLSHRAHAAVGFDEVERLVLFAKKIGR